MLALTAAPVLALVMQSLAYADVPWACKGGSIAALHAVGAVFTILAMFAVADAYALWKGSGRGVHTEDASAQDRSRFAALVGLCVSLPSVLLIVAMWVAVFVFDPCVR